MIAARADSVLSISCRQNRHPYGDRAPAGCGARLKLTLPDFEPVRRLSSDVMPALQMFGRRWALAADDVPVLAVPTAIFHLIWFIFLVVAFSAISKPSSCADTPSYEACIIGLFICFFLSAILEGWLAVEGMKGTDLVDES